MIFENYFFVDIGSQKFDKISEKYTFLIILIYLIEETKVTCLKYIQQINCIVVGLKFGGIQFYNLKDYSLM